jgi:UDP-glucuronate 4-epimerase
MPFLVTGAAGFIGMHVALALLKRGERVIGLDNLNDYYDQRLKRARLGQLQTHPGFRFAQIDLSDADAVESLFNAERPRQVIHLAAQAGVRYAIDHPLAYAQSNLVGMTVMLDACRRSGVEHLVFASSSSVYGGNQKVPFLESDPVDHPVSFYAATKRANELMAHSFAHLFALPCTGLRLFTVYGPWGRPDMAVWKFTAAMLVGQAIPVYGEGLLSRDFTYIDDCVNAILAIVDAGPAQAGAARSAPDAATAPFALVNIGRSDPVTVNQLIAEIERATHVRAVRDHQPMQPGDVERTFAGTTKLQEHYGVHPAVSLREGIERFVSWYRTWAEHCANPSIVLEPDSSS